MGPIRNPNWSTSRMRVTLSFLGSIVTTKTEQNNGIAMFNTSNEGMTKNTGIERSM
jgi:hypothetical protein